MSNEDRQSQAHNLDLTNLRDTALWKWVSRHWLRDTNSAVSTGHSTSTKPILPNMILRSKGGG